MRTLASACVGIAMLLAGGFAAAETQVVAMWPVHEIASSSAEVVQLRGLKEDILYAALPRSHVVRLNDALARLEAQAGVSTEFYIVQLSGDVPNAFARVASNGRFIVGITPAMLSLLGEDYDAYAAVLGHEIAHIVREHGAMREARRGLLQALGLIAGVLIGSRIGFNPGSLMDFGTSVVDRSFSRGEEREADKVGFEYMVAAGFDPAGAIRAHEKLLEARGSGGSLPFLATHPGGEERIATFQRMIASLPPKPSAAPVATVPEEKPPISVTEAREPDPSLRAGDAQ